ncbi:MAG: hypothetical protein ABSF43_00900 [Rectinemataceae bacterium]|jgi:hypothetical protein
MIRIESRRRRHSLAICFLGYCVVATLLLSSCGVWEKPSVTVKRESLFALGYGPAEDQLDLFQIDGSQAPLKTCLTMKEGIFYIANGAGAKVVRYSSFGDPLSMIYNAEKNPEPIVLKAVPAKSESSGGRVTPESGGLGRNALSYPFRAVGEIAVDSSQNIYVEDRLPSERRVQDKDSGAMLDHVVLRFDKDGQFIDYLGQEGIGGTPFPYIIGVYSVASDDCVVVSMTQTGWLVHWFDKKGVLVSSLRLKRGDLPMPDKGQGLIPSLDRIVPDIGERDLLIKIDYYKEAIDPSTKSAAGVEFESSWTYRMNLKDGKYVDRWQIHAIEKTAKNPDGQSVKYSRVPALLGAAGRAFFFIYADDDGKTYISTYDRTTREITRYALDISADELFYNAYYLSRDGVLCALLGTKYEARVVWWRFDKLIGANTGIVK